MPVCQKMWQTLPFLMLFLNDVDKYVLEESYKKNPVIREASGEKCRKIEKMVCYVNNFLNFAVIPGLNMFQACYMKEG